MNLLVDHHIILEVAARGELVDGPMRVLADESAYAMTEFGAPLLRANSDTEYQDFLVLTLDSERFRTWYRMYNQYALAALADEHLTPVGGPASPSWQLRLVNVFGENAVLASAVDQLIEQTVVVSRPAFVAAAHEQALGLFQHTAAHDPFVAMVSPEVPAVVGRILVERMYAEVELLAMSFALRRGRRVAAARSGRLLRSLAAHLKQGARLLTLVPGLQVPRKLVPARQALNLRKLQAQEAAAQLAAFHRRPEDVAHLFDD